VNTANAQTLAALICGGTKPPAKLCTDVEEAAKFFMLVTMVRGMTAGAPLFSSPKGFIDSLKHKSMMGQLLQTFGLERIQFFSESEAMKAISTESKVFSMISTGVVKAGKRETRVRVHAVVDYRGAPAPPEASPEMLQQLVTAGLAAGDTSGGAGQANEENLPEGATPDGFAVTMRPDPAGKIIYFQID
jgi:hypothetical protein